MTKRPNKKPVVDLNDEAVKRILITLLGEFKERKLGTECLHKSYEGLSPAQLKGHCCADGEVTEVDFELAMKDLSAGDLVKTGPIEPYPNDPTSGVLVMMLFRCLVPAFDGLG